MAADQEIERAAVDAAPERQPVCDEAQPTRSPGRRGRRHPGRSYDDPATDAARHRRVRTARSARVIGTSAREAAPACWRRSTPRGSRGRSAAASRAPTDGRRGTCRSGRRTAWTRRPDDDDDREPRVAAPRARARRSRVALGAAWRAFRPSSSEGQLVERHRREQDGQVDQRREEQPPRVGERARARQADRVPQESEPEDEGDDEVDRPGEAE